MMFGTSHIFMSQSSSLVLLGRAHFWAGYLIAKPFLSAGSSSDLKEFVVEGTTFNPDMGSIVGLTKLDKGLEVRTQDPS